MLRTSQPCSAEAGHRLQTSLIVAFGRDEYSVDVGAFFQSKKGINVEGTSRTVKPGNKRVSEMSHSAMELFHTGLFAHMPTCSWAQGGGHKHPQ